MYRHAVRSFKVAIEVFSCTSQDSFADFDSVKYLVPEGSGKVNVSIESSLASVDRGAFRVNGVFRPALREQPEAYVTLSMWTLRSQQPHRLLESAWTA